MRGRAADLSCSVVTSFVKVDRFCVSPFNLGTGLTFVVTASLLVVGTKRLHIFHPAQHSHLYISITPPQTNTSLIPHPPSSSKLDWKQYPMLRRALEDVRTTSCEVGPGESVLIPEGWYHCVESVGDEPAVSVNHWFR